MNNQNSQIISPVFKDKKAIVFAPDNKYCKYFAVALKSLILNMDSSEQYDVVVLASDFDDKNLYLLNQILTPNISLRFFDIDAYVKNTCSVQLKTMQYWSASMYYRIFIPLIMPEYERVIYLDSDICVHKSLSELLNLSFDGKELLSVIDTVSPIIDYRQTRKEHFINELGLKNPHDYFNSGMLVFNIPLINKEKYIEKCFDVLKTKILQFPDQDLLNVVFEGKVKLIDCKFNSQYSYLIFEAKTLDLLSDGYRENYLNGFYNPVIVHFTSSRKPWHSPLEKNAHIFWQYARQTPFYEVLLSDMFKRQVNLSIPMLPHVLRRHEYKMKYYKYKFLKYFVFGKKRKKYKDKKRKYKKLLKDIRQFMKKVS